MPKTLFAPPHKHIKHDHRYFGGEHHVYALIDPRNGKVRYIGFTFNCTQRLGSHRSTNSTKPIGQWMDELAADGVEPVFAVLETVVGCTNARNRESQLIRLYVDAGAPLLNDGGGSRGRFSKNVFRELAER